MSYTNPDLVEDEVERLVPEPAYIDEATRRRRLIPAAILAAPMAIAFVAMLLSPGGMRRLRRVASSI